MGHRCDDRVQSHTCPVQGCLGQWGYIRNASLQARRDLKLVIERGRGTQQSGLVESECAPKLQGPHGQGLALVQSFSSMLISWYCILDPGTPPLCKDGKTYRFEIVHSAEQFPLGFFTGGVPGSSKTAAEVPPVVSAVHIHGTSLWRMSVMVVNGDGMFSFYCPTMRGTKLGAVAKQVISRAHIFTMGEKYYRTC